MSNTEPEFLETFVEKFGGEDGVGLVEWAAEHSGVDALESPAEHVTVYARHATNRIEVVDTEKYQAAPRRITASPQLHTLESLAEYVARFHSAPTAVYVSPVAVTAVLDEATDQTPQWRGHRAIHQLKQHPLFALLAANCNKAMTQTEFAELVEDLAGAWVAPDAATMLEVAQTISIAGDKKLSSAITLANGSISMSYQSIETATAGARGDLVVPVRLTVRLPVYDGTDATQEVSLRLRTRRRDAAIEFVLRPDETIEQIVAKALKSVRAELLGVLAPTIPLFFGTP